MFTFSVFDDTVRVDTMFVHSAMFVPLAGTLIQISIYFLTVSLPIVKFHTI